MTEQTPEEEPQGPPAAPADPKLRDWTFTFRSLTKDEAEVQRLAYAEAVTRIEAEGHGVERVGVTSITPDPKAVPKNSAWFVNVTASGRLPR